MARRIYEYTDEEGRKFWSFHRIRPDVSFGHTLRISDRFGEHFIMFLTRMRNLYLNYQKDEDEIWWE